MGHRRRPIFYTAQKNTAMIRTENVNETDIHINHEESVTEWRICLLYLWLLLYSLFVPHHVHFFTSSMSPYDSNMNNLSFREQLWYCIMRWALYPARRANATSIFVVHYLFHFLINAWCPADERYRSVIAVTWQYFKRYCSR